MTVALVALLAVGAVVLNVAVWQGFRRHLLEDRWQQLVDHVDLRREAIRARVQRVEADAVTLVRHAIGPQWRATTAATEGRLGRALRDEARASGFESVRLVDADGAVLVSTDRDRLATPAADRELVRRAIDSGHAAAGVRSGAQGRVPMLVVAVPALGEAPAGGLAVAVLDAPMQDLLQPLHPTGEESSTGVYLALQDAEGMILLGSPPKSLGVRSGGRVPLEEPRVRAAAFAVRGVDSRIETAGTNGPLWGVTRHLPEVQAGLVAQADRDFMLGGARDVLAALLALDLGMALLAAAFLWSWRQRLVTRLAQREQEFTHRQTDRIRAVFDTVFDAILTFDAKGRVHSANRSAQVLLMSSAAQVEGEPVHRFLRCGAVGKSGAFVPLALDTVSCSEAMRSDGSVIPVEFSLACAGEDEDRVYTAVVRDISDRTKAESRIRSFAEGLEVTNRRLEEANAQLEEASRLKSEFLANTSHELRTPLNGMIGFLQLVLDGMCDSPEEERDFLTQALQCSRHLLGLINDVLDIAKIEAGKLALDIEAVEVQALFGEVYSLTHVQAAQKGIALHFDAPERCTYPVRGDFGKIKQVLLNLIGNSLKFTTRGSITVRATERADVGHYQFEVVDTGIGIPVERQKLIFEKFTQGDGSSTRKYGGTGLGLAISKSLVELMGGIITVHSDGPGQGTSMYFSLPVWRTSEDSIESSLPPPTDKIEGPAGGALVLLVEDDPVFRQFLSTLLQRHGHRTIEADTAESGWVLARRTRPAAVVLDYALSCSDAASLRTGWDLAERMSSDPETRQIPLVFVTGFDTHLRDKLMTTTLARQPQHLMKPVEGDTLLTKIRQVLGESRDGTMRILLADDDPAVSAYVRKVLPDNQFHLEVANNGEECLHILRMQPHGFDLLILDLMMPDVSGYDVLRELSLSRTSVDLPVLILTNFPEARDEEEKRLLDRGLVLDVVPKSSVHENPVLLPHIIDWHLQVAAELAEDSSETMIDDPTDEQKAAA